MCLHGCRVNIQPFFLSMDKLRAEPVHNRWQQFALEAEKAGSPVDVSARAISALASEPRSSLGWSRYIITSSHYITDLTESLSSNCKHLSDYIYLIFYLCALWQRLGAGWYECARMLKSSQYAVKHTSIGTLTAARRSQINPTLWDLHSILEMFLEDANTPVESVKPVSFNDPEQLWGLV